MDEEKPKLDMSSRKLGDARGYIYEGDIIKYDFSLGVSVPVEKRKPLDLLGEMLGRPEAMLISPEGYLLVDYYAVPARKGAKKGDGVEWTDTKKGIMRSWMMKVPEFRRELEENGWIYVPHVEEMDDVECKELGCEHKHLMKRSLGLDDMVKVLEFEGDKTAEMCAFVLKDLKELRGYVGNGFQLVYETADSLGIWPVHLMKGTVKGEDRMGITLQGLSWRHNDEPNTLRREIDLSVPIRDEDSLYGSKLPDWWGEGSTKRVVGVASDLAKSRGVSDRNCRIYREKDTFVLELANREEFRCDASPDTGRLVADASAIQDCLKTLVERELSEHKKREAAKYDAAKKAVGLGETATK